MNAASAKASDDYLLNDDYLLSDDPERAGARVYDLQLLRLVIYQLCMVLCAREQAHAMKSPMGSCYFYDCYFDDSVTEALAADLNTVGR